MEIFRHDTPVAIPQRGHFDYELRLRDMDAGAHRHGDRLADLPERLLGHRGRQLRGGARIQRQHGGGAEALARPHPLVHLAALGISAARRRGAAAQLRCRRGRRDGAGQHRRPQPDRSAVRADLGGDRPARAAGAGAPDRPARHRRRWT